MSANIRHSSATNEHFTPSDVVEAARSTLGKIDFDPASCDAANKIVKATNIWTKSDNGFIRPWGGFVFMNPPGGWCDVLGQEIIKRQKKPPRGPCTETGDCGLPPGHTHQGCEASQKKWWEELVARWLTREVEAAVFVCFSLELLQASQQDPQVPRLPLSFPICYPSKRVRYLKADGTVGESPTHSSCIICVDDGQSTHARFKNAYSKLGHVVIPSP